MLSRKTFATNSLVQKFLYDVWFGRDANYYNIKYMSLINKIIANSVKNYKKSIFYLTFIRTVKNWASF